METSPRDSPTPKPTGWSQWASLGPALVLIAGITAARIAYLVWVCPYELAADEAQYWDWSRRLDLSYYSKGPGVAAIIAASTRLFGDAEWAVRLPAAVSAAVTMLALAALAADAAGSGACGRRAAWLAVAAFCLIPAYHLTSILMTIDAPYLACWALACLAAWRVRRTRSAPAWAALGVALGVGFLFKYTILLLVPGLLLHAVLARPFRAERASPVERASGPLISLGGPLLACCLFALVISPVVIWNHRHGWPTLAHLLGHLGAPGGDVPPQPWRYSPLWTLEFLGAQAGMIGPIVALMFLAVRDGIPRRGTQTGGESGAARREAAVFALCAAAPVLLFYFAVSIVARVEGNWPIAGWLTLLVPLGIALSGGPAAGMLRGLWRAAIVYGVIGALGVHAINLLDRVPVLTEAIPYHRINGHRDWAQRIADAAARRTDLAEARFIANRYTWAALAAYYLPGRPSVASAESRLGGRRSSYDYFDDTALDGPGFIGRPAVLIGATGERWRRAFSIGLITPLLPAEGRRPAVYLGWNYQGPRRADHAHGDSP